MLFGKRIMSVFLTVVLTALLICCGIRGGRIVTTAHFLHDFYCHILVVIQFFRLGNNAPDIFINVFDH